jgi:RpiR family transcriptional regulator, carbohydrate utilization regulator
MIIAAIEAQIDTLRPSERAVASFILGRPSVVVSMSIADLAEQCEVSEPTIVRFCRAIGCLGFMELKLGLARDLERRTFMMNRVNTAVKGPVGFGQALFQRTLDGIAGLAQPLGFDRLDDALEWCAVSRAISVLHDGSETTLASDVVEALLACKLEARADTRCLDDVRLDGRVVICLRSAARLEGFDQFCERVVGQSGKIVIFGFQHALADISFDLNDVPSPNSVQREIAYLTTLETLRAGIDVRLSRRGDVSDEAQEFLQSHREIAYGDARRRGRQAAQVQEAGRQAAQAHEVERLHRQNKEQV